VARCRPYHVYGHAQAVGQVGAPAEAGAYLLLGFNLALAPGRELPLRREQFFGHALVAGEPIRDFLTAWRSALDRAAHDERNGLRVVIRPQLLGRIPHDLRRTAVRNLERAGFPRSVAMKLTGHKTESVYHRYAIVAEQDLAEGVAKVAKLVALG
jgi:integrase